jgi:hypothetical protein
MYHYLDATEEALVRMSLLDEQVWAVEAFTRDSRKRYASRIERKRGAPKHGMDFLYTRVKTMEAN